MSTVLDRCSGPPCPRCGCQDSEILQWPNNGESWYATGRARCRHCGTRFAFRPARTQPRPTDEVSPVTSPEIAHQEPPPLSTRPIRVVSDPTLCPQCGGKAKVASTRPGYRRMKCSACGHAFKIAK